MDMPKMNFDARDFNDMGKILHTDFTQGMTIREGQIFEAGTVKGGKNLIVAMRADDEFIFYSHADKLKKVEKERFIAAVLHGDLEPKNPKNIDTERLAQCQIGLDAIANRKTIAEQIDHMGEAAAERHKLDKWK